MTVTYLTPFVLGLVEGLTEFIPVSSTGHLILAERLIGSDGAEAALLDVVIQVGAILAICWVYRAKLAMILLNLGRDQDARKFLVNVLLAFLPAAIVGAAAHDFINTALFTPKTVVISLILGSVAILLIEGVLKRRRHSGTTIMSPRLTFCVGLYQLLALIPGVSRAGATIMGGLLLGIDRKIATEFSFFLAIPTKFGAASLDLFVNRSVLTTDSAVSIAIGTSVSFIVAIVVVKWLIAFVSKHGFIVFGWYRIILGTSVLVLVQA